MKRRRIVIATVTVGIFLLALLAAEHFDACPEAVLLDVGVKAQRRRLVARKVTRDGQSPRQIGDFRRLRLPT